MVGVVYLYAEYLLKSESFLLTPQRHYAHWMVAPDILNDNFNVAVVGLVISMGIL